VLYSVAAHWAWTSQGFLSAMHFRDFAGAGIVHLLGGACAVTATCFIGPRTGRFGALPPLLIRWSQRKEWLRDRLGCGQRKARTRTSAASSSSSSPSGNSASDRDGARPAPQSNGGLRRRQIERTREAREFRVSDPVNLIYGTFILFVGWISFNCSGTYGVTSGRENLTARVGVVTCVGGAAGTTAGLLYSYVVTNGKAFEIEPASVGALAGLVSITAACANIGIWEGAFAGFVGGLLGCSSRSWFEYFQIDDPVGAIPVHFVGGVWGLLVVGLFHRADGYGPSTLPGAIHGGGGELLAIQLLGALVILVWGSAGTAFALLLMQPFMSVRVSKEDEKLGLDTVEHGVGLEPQGRSLVVAPARAFLRRRLRKRSLSSPPPKASGSSAASEFVEDIAHAERVQASVRKFTLNLRTRAIAKRAGASVPGGGAVEATQISVQSRASSDEVAVVAVAASP
jgi:ammonia channel protein AmtB